MSPYQKWKLLLATLLYADWSFMPAEILWFEVAPSHRLSNCRATNRVAPPTAPRTESWVDMSFVLLSMLESISIDSTTAPIAEPYDLGPLAFSPLESHADPDAASTSPWSSLFSRIVNIFDELVFWPLESRADTDVASTSPWPSLFRRSAGPFEVFVSDH